MLKMFLRSVFVPVAFFSSQLIFAQSDRIQQLETEVRGASGAARVEKLIELSNAYVHAGNYEKAEDTANEAADFARKIGQSMLRAVALNSEGKAMVLSGKRKAAGKFEQSLDILRDSRSNNKSLMLDNLENLRQIAIRAGKKEKEIAGIEARIARLNEIAAPPATPLPPPPASPARNCGKRYRRSSRKSPNNKSAPPENPSAPLILKNKPRNCRRN
ncbi:MAG: hypothetical protein DYG98_26650 [Haliscomenobacteraceae bacterium CHB4]|nr:hypothetical protein [Haliscomenobacteraceae bacterium CHB4]